MNLSVARLCPGKSCEVQDVQIPAELVDRCQPAEYNDFLASSLGFPDTGQLLDPKQLLPVTETVLRSLNLFGGNLLFNGQPGAVCSSLLASETSFGSCLSSCWNIAGAALDKTVQVAGLHIPPGADALSKIDISGRVVCSCLNSVHTGFVS